MSETRQEDGGDTPTVNEPPGGSGPGPGAVTDTTTTPETSGFWCRLTRLPVVVGARERWEGRRAEAGVVVGWGMAVAETCATKVVVLPIHKLAASFPYVTGKSTYVHAL